MRRPTHPRGEPNFPVKAVGRHIADLDFKSVLQLSTLFCPSLQSPNDKPLVATSQASGTGGPRALKSLGERLPLSLLLDDISSYCADRTGQCKGRYETF